MVTPISREQWMTEALACTLVSMPVGAVVGYLGAICFTVINPVAGAWLGMGVLSWNAMSIFLTKKIMDQPSTCKALSAYSIVFIASTAIGTLLALDAFKLALTTAEVLTLLTANAAIIGIGLGVFIIGATVFYCTAKCFCPDVIEAP